MILTLESKLKTSTNQIPKENKKSKTRTRHLENCDRLLKLPPSPIVNCQVNFLMLASRIWGKAQHTLRWHCDKTSPTFPVENSISKPTFPVGNNISKGKHVKIRWNMGWCHGGTQLDLKERISPFCTASGIHPTTAQCVHCTVFFPFDRARWDTLSNLETVILLNIYLS